jgi:hypothetical protein
MQNGRETLEKLFRVHLPESKLIDDSGGGQGQQNVDVCKGITNWGDWNRLTDQSRIRWGLSTLKPLKSTGTDGIVMALLLQGA